MDLKITELFFLFEPTKISFFLVYLPGTRLRYSPPVKIPLFYHHKLSLLAVTQKKNPLC